MFYKIYFNNKPFFLCDELQDDLKDLLQSKHTVYKNHPLSLHAVTSMIDTIANPLINAAIYQYSNLPALKEMFWQQFKVQLAAGGLVFNQHQEILMIYRRNKWDLPKGKQDPPEQIQDCALREVAEETGVASLTINHFLTTTYHIYHENNLPVLKESHWYKMSVPGSPLLTPQTSEEITAARWITTAELPMITANTYPSIIDVLSYIE
jgi:8-oxo-dGTP pyrophosphatase MutT (NUDIX family)